MYSLTARVADPRSGKPNRKIYPTAQCDQVVGLRQFARHIQSHGSPFTRDIIIGVLSAAADCLREQLVAGNRVDLGDLGSFYLTLRSDGVERAEDFNPQAHVRKVGVRWDPSSLFDNLKDDPGLKWEFTLTRKDMAQAKRLAKEEVLLSAGITPPDASSDTQPPLLDE